MRPVAYNGGMHAGCISVMVAKNLARLTNKHLIGFKTYSNRRVDGEKKYRDPPLDNVPTVRKLRILGVMWHVSYLCNWGNPAEKDVERI